jgi:hypothetical protein
MSAVQEFQKIEVKISVDDRPLNVEVAYLYGKRINIIGRDKVSGNYYTFSGNIDSNNITRIVQIAGGSPGRIENWSATRH